MSQPTVVVTGASGFIAKHIIIELLKHGYQVRGTLRDSDKASTTSAAIATAGGDTGALSFVAADLNSDAGWDDAFRGADVVLHTASPFPMQQPDNPDDLIQPARDGTLRVLNAARRSGVRRVVITSSTVAILYASNVGKDHVYSEETFTDANRSDLTPYIRSKTLAEQAAWDDARAHPDGPEIVVLNPGFVQGPALDADLSTSHELFQLMARGLYPAAPKIRFPVVHVADVAKAHRLAIENARAAGHRYLLADQGFMGLYELGRVMGELLPDLAKKAPKFEMPDIAVRALAVADKRLRTILPELGQTKAFSNQKASSELGLTFIDGKTAVSDSIRSLRALGLI